MLNEETYKELVLARKSIYPVQFDPSKTVEDEKIETLLEMANWAPTHKYTEPWSYIVYSGEGINKYFDGLKEIYIKTTEHPDEKKIAKYDTKKDQVSHIIALITSKDEANRVPEIEEICASSCAAQNIYLGLAPLGLAGYWSTGNVCFSPEMHDFLQLKENQQCLGFFHIGYPKEDLPTGNRKRQDIKGKTTWMKG